MTAEEQAMDVAKRYINGSDREKKAILSCFSEEEKLTFLEFIGLQKLFNDSKYYAAVKKAVCEQLL